MVKYMLHDICRSKKPMYNAAKKYITKEATIKELIADIESGKSIRPGITLDNKSTDKDWIEQELVFVDVDDYPISHSMNICSILDIQPIFTYKSFGYSDQQQKHRLVFKLDTLITDADCMLLLNNKMIKVFGADTRCNGLSRCYYGTKYGVENVNEKATINVSIIDKINKLLNTKQDAENIEATRVAQTPHGFLKPTKDAVKQREKDPQLKNLIYIPKGISCGSQSTFSLKKITPERSVFNDYSDIAKYFKQIDLTKALGGSNIKCILPDHENDKNPSASIYQSENGYYYYKCHACDNDPLDIYGLISIFYDIKGPNNYVFYKCTNILIDEFNLSFTNSKWKAEQDRIIKANKIILRPITTKTKELVYSEKYPRATKEFIKRHRILEVLTEEALIALEVCPTKKGNKLLFNTSLRYIADKTGYDFSSVGKWIKFLCYLGFIEKIDHNKIKDTKMGKLITQYAKANNLNRVPQVYSIPEWTEKVFKIAEERYDTFKKHGGTLKGATARQFEALNCKTTVTQKNKETSKIKAIRDEIRKYIYSKERYCLVKDLKSFGKEKGYSDKLISSFITEISKEKDLIYFRRASKAVKEKYKITDDIHHTNSIIIKK